MLTACAVPPWYYPFNPKVMVVWFWENCCWSWGSFGYS